MSRRWGQATVITLVAALLSAACGGDDSGDSGSRRVTVGITSFNSLHLGFLNVQEMNLMEKYDVELDVVTFQNTGQILPAILSGDVQFGFLTPEQLFAAQDDTPNVKMVASENHVNPYQLIARPEIDSAEDLEGATIGVTSPGSSADYFTIKLMLEDHGLVEGEDYDFVTAGPPPDRSAALLGGDVDAVAVFEPDTAHLTDEGMTVLDEAADYDNLTDLEIGSLVADENWYGENEALAVDFLRGYLAGQQSLYDPSLRDETIANIANEMDISEDAAELTYTSFVEERKAPSRDVRIDPERLAQTAENAVATDVEGAPSPDDLDWRYDNSLAEAAQGSR
jgi:ABC-type nitrate/sulfonate/bicarbonate transport system substrate-binding protein